MFVQRILEGESTIFPKMDENKIRNNLDLLWPSLPAGALMHDQNAYVKATQEIILIDNLIDLEC